MIENFELSIEPRDGAELLSNAPSLVSMSFTQIFRFVNPLCAAFLKIVTKDLVCIQRHCHFLFFLTI